MPTLSEADSKALVARYGVPVPAEAVVSDPDEAARAAAAVGFPAVVKLCGDGLAHKTERGLVRLNLADAGAVRAAAGELLAAARAGDGPVGLLVAPMVSGLRELIAGLVRDPQFGPAVMLGIGGVLAEALADVSFRLVPFERADAEEMIEELGHQTLLGPLRGEGPVDREALIGILVGLARLAESEPDVISVDLNPLVVSSGVPVAVDALVEVADR